MTTPGDHGRALDLLLALGRREGLSRPLVEALRRAAAELGRALAPPGAPSAQGDGLVIARELVATCEAFTARSPVPADRASSPELGEALRLIAAPSVRGFPAARGYDFARAPTEPRPRLADLEMTPTGSVRAWQPRAAPPAPPPPRPSPTAPSGPSPSFAAAGLVPAIENKTRFAAEMLLLADERARPVATFLVKGTFDVVKGRCVRSEAQAPISLEGELWGADPAVSSCKLEPEIAFVKLATDVILLGHAHAPSATATEVMVGLGVGALTKQLLVLGDRVWWKHMGQIQATAPRRFEKIPLLWERAFGGRDEGMASPGGPACDARNPVGVGFRPSRKYEEGLRLPNLEDPVRRLARFGEDVAPVGFGFVSPHWQPRARLAGTYDERWRAERAPLLPKDFDRRHLNAAPADQIVAGYLRGDEPVAALGVVPEGRLQFSLPGLPPPVAVVRLRTGETHRLATALDTLIIDADRRRVTLLWRCHLPLRAGPLSMDAAALVDGP